MKNKFGGANSMHGKGDTSNMQDSFAVNDVLRSSVTTTANPEGLNRS
jgi:hypothetical protein